MSQVDCTSMEPSGDVEQVALYLPASTPAPEPARKIGFLKALLLYWIVPGQLGPHLAVDSWKRACGAHLVSLLFASSVVWHLASRSESDLIRNLTSPHEIRKTLAGALLDLTTRSPLNGFDAAKVAALLFVLFLIEAAPLFLACFSLPWCCDGDDGKSMTRRSFKNSYWATTILIPATVFYWVGYGLPAGGSGLSLQSLSERVPVATQLGLILLAGFLVLRMLLTGTARYVGEAVGPGFAPREPLCGACGYRITGLPVAGRCPECGEPVRDSLPGGKRQPTAWQHHELSWREFVVLIRMQEQIIRSPDFLQTLPVHDGLASGRRFWWGTFLLMLPAMFGAAWGIDAVLRLITEGCLDTGSMGPEGLLILLAPVAIQTLVMFVAGQWAETRLKIKDFRVSATVCYYASPLIWPLTLLAPLMAVAISGRLNRIFSDEWVVPMLGTRLTVTDMMAIVLGLVALIALWFLSTRLGRALRAASHANA